MKLNRNGIRIIGDHTQRPNRRRLFSGDPRVTMRPASDECMDYQYEMPPLELELFRAFDELSNIPVTSSPIFLSGVSWKRYSPPSVCGPATRSIPGPTPHPFRHSKMHAISASYHSPIAYVPESVNTSATPARA
jgi:hypothetical protein